MLWERMREKEKKVEVTVAEGVEGRRKTDLRRGVTLVSVSQMT